MTSRSKAPVDPNKRRFNVVITTADLEAFKKAADKAGLTMSSWSRMMLRHAAQRALRKPSWPNASRSP